MFQFIFRIHGIYCVLCVSDVEEGKKILKKIDTLLDREIKANIEYLEIDEESDSLTIHLPGGGECEFSLDFNPNFILAVVKDAAFYGNA